MEYRDGIYRNHKDGWNTSDEKQVTPEKEDQVRRVDKGRIRRKRVLYSIGSETEEWGTGG